MRINKKDLNKDTRLEVFLEFLEQEIKDVRSRVRLDDFEQGVSFGEIKIVDLIRSICK